jgi:hypothetical protein
LFQHVPAYSGEQLNTKETGPLSRFFCVRMILVDAPYGCDRCTPSCTLKKTHNSGVHK